MKILFFTRMPYLGSEASKAIGGGWVNELLTAFKNYAPQHKLGYSYVTSQMETCREEDDISLYPLYDKALNRLQRLYHNWLGYSLKKELPYLDQMQETIRKFNPDIIYIFGIETDLPEIIPLTQVPCTVHIQGILAPCLNAFFPPSINLHSIFRYNCNVGEYIFNNQFRLAYKGFIAHTKKEQILCKKLTYIMGRTEWDKLVFRILAPQAKYYQAGELLRSTFYQSEKWTYEEKNKIILTSTISPVMYKGLDLIFKTAKLLKQNLENKFEWRIIGISPKSYYVNFIEKIMKTKSRDINIYYKGSQKADEVIKHLLSSNFYIHPSYIDNSPNSLCEAQILGVPCIACYCGGISSLISHQINGLVVPANDPYELAALISFYSKDIFFLQSISQKAIQTAEVRHNPKRVIEEITDSLQAIIKDAKSNETIIRQ